MTTLLRPPRDASEVRSALAGPLVAAVMLVAGLLTMHSLGLPLRDPDHVAAQYLVAVGFGVSLLVALDVVLRARARAGSFPPPWEALVAVRRERWTRGRAFAAGGALIAFYASYLAYRNLKAVVPLLRPGELFDDRLATMERGIFAGRDPAVLLHDALGTGIAAHALSTAYVAFILFLPLTIGLALVFSPDIRGALVYTTAQSLNWMLGIASYLVLPSLGPIYAQPSVFAQLPHSEVTRLQGVLFDQRVAFLAHPATATPQSIAAFASLHVSMSFTAALAAQLLGLPRGVRIALWTWLGITTVGTIYLGWHYVLDDVAGFALGGLALGVARALSGARLHVPQARSDRRRLRRVSEPA